MHDVFENAQRLELIELAEQTIRQGALLGERPHVDLHAWPRWAAKPRATFVTVYVDGRLNGCIGTLKAQRPVAEDIASNAYQAAFADRRFAAVSAVDLEDVSVHLAVLGPLKRLDVSDERDLITQMRVGMGIVLDDGDRRGTFLPAVWEKLPDPHTFLLHLKRKAGFGEAEWPDEIEVFRFEVEEFDRETLQAKT